MAAPSLAASPLPVPLDRLDPPDDLLGHLLDRRRLRARRPAPAPAPLLLAPLQEPHREVGIERHAWPLGGTGSRPSPALRLRPARRRCPWQAIRNSSASSASSSSSSSALAKAGHLRRRSQTAPSEKPTARAAARTLPHARSASRKRRSTAAFHRPSPAATSCSRPFLPRRIMLSLPPCGQSNGPRRTGEPPVRLPRPPPPTPGPARDRARASGPSAAAPPRSPPPPPSGSRSPAAPQETAPAPPPSAADKAPLAPAPLVHDPAPLAILPDRNIIGTFLSSTIDRTGPISGFEAGEASPLSLQGMPR